ncbi:peptide chain release factor N(5)-glutamine methyltransferase [Pseudomonas sp. P66]|uniref:peptide chain release factor N(5)-glutamine methyltransferase n=1 Tax=Pseudomonas arcuscaelestis TaxID=2710591 RepID=A0ABS2BTY0_9PSED|nr:HemK/PrmC family methyltransferase [Pseudomonas arcuscaelestis]MBM3112648.1 peptide chain release factor N(5)-glutamine methyltransferase [Pseudomonas arcuscaelestis]MBM5457095.1 peptide chain release factor N(5)-glutamine methyltransferase [Pseudomonas arcuscaelestis]
MSLDEREQHEVARARHLLKAASVWDVDGDLQALVDRFLERSNKARALDEFKLAVSERCNRIPLGHIVGAAEFDQMPLVIGSGVFIPRQHSTIIHTWLDKQQLDEGSRVLDLCAGSGAIGLAIAQRRPDLAVTCVEFDDVAAHYLKRNIARMACKGIWADALQADIRDTSVFAPFTGQVALIVANPPYVPLGLELLPEWSSHHPQASVYSGADGLELIRHIVELAVAVLVPGGWLVIEHGVDQASAVCQLFQQHSFTQVEVIIDPAASDTTGIAVMTVGRLRDDC